jgi:Ca2+-binding EF-hand superfamily protein
LEDLLPVLTQPRYCSLGMNPKTLASVASAQEIFDDVVPKGGSLNLAAFTNIMSGKRDFPDTKADVLEAFVKIGDPNATGMIDEAKLQAALTTFGAAPLSQGEVRYPHACARRVGSTTGIAVAGIAESL